MRNIIITDGIDTINLKTDLVFQLDYEAVGVTKTMASGKIVRDIVGYRPMLNIPTGYVEKADIIKLKNMINSGRFLSITYPSVDGDKTQTFLVEPPTFKSFKYDDDGISIWYGVTLRCTAQEVE